MLCENVELIDNILQAEDFVRLRVEAGFAEVPVEHARRALQNGLINVSVIYQGELIGMGRMVGDGGSREPETARELGMHTLQAVWYLRDDVDQPSGRKPEFRNAEFPMDVCGIVKEQNEQHFACGE